MELKEFFELNKEIAVAFSGGADSAYLLYGAVKYSERCRAYYVKSAFQPAFELIDAMKLAAGIGADLKIIEADVLCDKNISCNPADRCYHCKKLLFGRIIEEAEKDGFSLIIDGTNASDDIDDRPGFRALGELSVRSPLRECGLTKDEIRSLSREAGLFTWDKPAYACLATRVPTGEEITAERLLNIEKAEDILFSMGYTDFRVRNPGDAAKLQFKRDQLERAESEFGEIKQRLEGLFDNIFIDGSVTR